MALSPVYDLVSSRLVIPEEHEELALTLNGRQNRLCREDFLAFAQHLEIAPDYAAGRIEQLCGLEDTFKEMIGASQLSSPLKERFVEILVERLERLRFQS